MYKVCEVILFWEQKTFMNKNQVKIPLKKKKKNLEREKTFK